MDENHERAENKPEEEHSIKALAGTLADNTATHGISNIKRSKSLVRKCVWIALICAATVMFCAQSGIQLKKYMSGPIKTAARFRLNSKTVEVPSVTICNKNSMRFSEYKKLVPTFYDKFDAADVWRLIGSEAVSAKFAAKLNQTQQLKVGHQLEDTILKTILPTTNELPYFAEYFDTSNIELDKGNCFTFNPSRRTEDGEWIIQIKVSRSLAMVGVTFLLNASLEEYMPLNTPQPGFSVMISPPGYSYIGVKPFFVRAGTMNTAKIQQTDVYKVRAKKHCMEEEEANRNRIRDVFKEMHGTKYGIETCKKTCKQKKLIQTCGCSSGSMPLTDMLLQEIGWANEDQPPVCEILNGNPHYCFKMIDLFEDEEDKCDCPTPCHQTSYHILWESSDTINYNRTHKWKDFVSEYDNAMNVTEYFEKNSDWTDEMQNRYSLKSLVDGVDELAWLHVMLENSMMKEVHEEIMYKEADLAGDVGGLLGLYVGMSVLAIYEIIEFLVDAAILLLQRLPQARNKKDANNDKDGAQESESFRFISVA